MNTYGDDGNVTVLKKRCEWRGIGVEVKVKSLKSGIKSGEIDLYFFGGGQDQAQELVAQDLAESGKREAIWKDIERGVPMLAICGGYQLLGEYYQPHKGPKLMGLGIFPAYTKASYDRMIGNIVISTQFGDLVGFENHSGKTFLKKNAQPVGTVKMGFGNNGEDKTEGCIYKNAVGCYMHGSLLPKNPKLADWLINKALDVKYGKDLDLEPLNDSLENLAHNSVIQRLR